MSPKPVLGSPLIVPITLPKLVEFLVGGGIFPQGGRHLWRKFELAFEQCSRRFERRVGATDLSLRGP